MTFSSTSNDYPFVAEGGLPAPTVPQRDPFLALDDLMAVVEALSPIWPQRDPMVDTGKMRL